MPLGKNPTSGKCDPIMLADDLSESSEEVRSGRSAICDRSRRSSSFRPRASGASDVHFQPGAAGLDLTWRIDGVLQAVTSIPAKVGPNIVARLKVLSELLTYRTDVPQEGRIKGEPGEVEMRVSTFPTLFGEKAVVRLFAAPGLFLRIEELGLPAEVSDGLGRLLGETSGAIVLAGPSGSGKTTTIYACLRELAARSKGQRSLATLEDPIEAVVPGVAQAQVNLAAGLTLESGLKSLLRQDPEVIAIGEIRDRATAEIALQAALTGHLILTTFHAGSACEVIGRLLDMGIEPYVVRSGLRAWWPSAWCDGSAPARRPLCTPTSSWACPCKPLACRMAASSAGAQGTAAAPCSRSCCFPSTRTSPAPSCAQADVRQPRTSGICEPGWSIAGSAPARQ